jgi:hypothetical protein
MNDEKLFFEQTSDIVEGLCNLTYLICEDADQIEKISHYAGLSEQRLQVMIDLLRSEW